MHLNLEERKKVTLSFFDDWILKPELLPAWLQAGAAVIALGLGVWSVRASSASQRQHDRLEVRGLAVAIYPELCMLPTMIQNVHDGLGKLPIQDGDQSFPASLQLTATLQLTPMLERNIDKLFLLGEVAGPSCLQLVRLLLQYNAFIETVATSSLMMSAAQRREALTHINEHLTLLDQVVTKSEHEVRPVHDSVKG